MIWYILGFVGLITVDLAVLVEDRETVIQVLVSGAIMMATTYVCLTQVPAIIDWIVG